MDASEPIQRPRPMFMELAHRLAEEIKSGRYEPGAVLPSESQMVAMYKVGKHTVRSAIAELRGMGLVYVRQGKGTIVRDRDQVVPPAAVDRSVQRTSRGWSLPQPVEVEPPVVTRTTLDGAPANLLRQEDQDALSVDRMLRDESGVRMAHRVIIPLATAADVPSLAEAPDAPAAELYQQLTDAGYSLLITEEVTARIPYPDERSALGVTDASPILVTYRVISDAKLGHPLMCEELRVPSTCRLSYPLAKSRTAAKRTARPAE